MIPLKMMDKNKSTLARVSENYDIIAEVPTQNLGH